VHLNSSFSNADAKINQISLLPNLRNEKSEKNFDVFHNLIFSLLDGDILFRKACRQVVNDPVSIKRELMLKFLVLQAVYYQTYPSTMV